MSGVGLREEAYSIYSPFNAEEHKKKYINYLKVVILEDGTVEYAIPSHQEKLIKIACQKLSVNRSELDTMCPPQYWCDFMRWLSIQTGAIAVWTDGYVAAKVNRRQLATMKRLKLFGIYKGKLPENECQ